ncbi:hypothetical protein, partial [Campylobacter lari]|uniref:hypothetical protein n=1 Tax=Campylobacter lari TaxID=201 RepID=UPI001BDA3FE1
ICWLSRLNIDKITALLNLIENFAYYPTDKKKRLHIIGVMEFQEKLLKNLLANIKNISNLFLLVV